MIALFGVVGAGLVLVAQVWIAVIAFRRGVLWGLGVLLCIPIVPLIFVILNWRETKVPAALYLAGWLIGGWAGLQLQHTESLGRGAVIEARR
jgi:hypothetical protein